jgi:hypothetical protein
MQAQIHFQFKNCASRWHQRCRSLNGNYGIDAVRISLRVVSAISRFSAGLSVAVS